jgi:hypothetical protein
LSGRRLIGDAVDEVSLEQVRVAAARHDLLGDPLQVFQRIRTVRQEVDGVLHRDRPDVRQPLAHLGAQVERTGRNAVDEDQPARHNGTIAVVLLYSNC